ncbi:MAG: serine hydrolase [Lawsonibacter sp.]|nr:serine hydrolase [Lawsonibacter sp.]
MNHYFQRIAPWEAGLGPDRLIELYRFLSKPEMGLHSFMVLRHGKVASEAWWTPYGPEKPHTMFSASKTFTGLAAGFAVEEGLLDLDDRVVDFFSDYLPAKTCENMEKMRVRHLLTMTTGFAKDPHDFPWPRPDDVLATGPHCCHQGIEQPQIDWVRNFFHHYVAYEPGTEFVYCTHGTYMLSAVIQRAVGKTVSEYLNEKLFQPLGIGTPSWETGPDGYTVGGWGLMLTTEQLAVVGQWLLGGGSWNGVQLLSEQWIRDASSVHITMDHLDEPHMAGYGYQMWIDRREGAYHFKGAFGQECTVIPGKDMVVVYTGGSSSQARREAAEKIWELLVTPAGPALPAPADPEALCRLTASLGIQLQEGTPSWQNEYAERWNKKRYVFGDNRLNFTWLSLEFAQSFDQCDQLTLGLGDRSFTVPVGFGTWREGKTCVSTPETDTDVSIIFEHVSSSGAWRDGHYFITLCFDETSYINQLDISFHPGGVVLRHTRNCSFFAASDAVLIGLEE